MRTAGYEPVRREISPGERMRLVFDEIAERKRLDAEREYWDERNRARGQGPSIRIDLRRRTRRKRGILVRIVDAIAGQLGFVRKWQGPPRPRPA